MTDSYCDVCNQSTKAELLYQKWQYDVVCCSTCSLIYTLPDANFDAQLFYSADYFDGSRHDSYKNYEGDEKILKKEFVKVLNKLRIYRPNATRLLELGSAYGYFLDLASEEYQVKGIEISADAVDSCKARNLDVSTNLSQLDGDSRFDLAVLLDCIEHLQSPRSELAQIHDKLDKDGILYLTTGDIGSLFARLGGKNWRLMTPPQHLFFYSTKSITTLLDNLGFRVIDISHPFKIIPFSLIFFILNNRYKLKFFEHRFFRWFERFGIPLNFFDAMTVVAQKK